MNIHEMNLDVTKKMTVAQMLHLGQGDANGTTLHANIYDDGVPLSLTGKSARLCLRLPDGKSYYAVEGTVSGSVATFDIDETYAASVAGQTDVAYVEIIEGTTVICSTNRFHVVVLESAEEGADPSTSYSSGIIEATNRANAAAEAAEGVVLQAVPTMSANIKGGAKLGAGLAVTDDTLSLDASSIVMESEKGSAYGVAELDENGIVISSQLPSYVDDVLEYPSASSFPTTGESGKIYVDISTNLTYRWTGTGYAEISPSLALGETSSTAYRGDRGAAAYAHGVTNKGTALSNGLYKITTNSEGHVTAGTSVTGADIAGKINGQAITPASVAATGDVTAVKNGTTYSLGTLGESVSQMGAVTFRAWTATSTSSAGSFVTDSMPLQAGTYIVVLSTPRVSVANQFGVRINGVGWAGWVSVSSANGYASGVWVITLQSGNSIQAGVGGSASTTYSDTNLGGLWAIRLA